MTDPLSKKNKSWSARFSEPVSRSVQDYTASVNFDKKLAIYDIEASLAHAEMLKHQKIITTAEYKKIKDGLFKIIDEIKQKKFIWSVALEDVHLNIESRLTELIGDAGKKLHTARSRNDQISTDMRLFLRDEVDNIRNKLKDLRMALIDQAENHHKLIMPGLTHLQVAQPVSFGHHLMAYEAMFSRDDERLSDSRKRINRLPLGSAALAGTSFAIDRKMVAKKLKFDSLCENSLDAVSDRDFVIEFLSTISILMLHISRLSEEIILWMSTNFDFIDLPDKFCTGSSIMPQKKNPDVPELARGKSARTIGNLITLVALMKNQPLAYNKDNQEDKEPLFDSVETVNQTLEIFSELISLIKPKPNNMMNACIKGYPTATDLADYLVTKNIPFREAHEIVSKVVSFAISKNQTLDVISIDKFKNFCSSIDSDVYKILKIEGSVNARNHIGGTSFKSVLKQIDKARKKIKRTSEEITKLKK